MPKLPEISCTDTSYPPLGQGADPISDQDLDAINGAGITGQHEAKRLLDEYLASVDIMSRRTDLSDDEKSTLQSFMTAQLSKKIGEAVSITPAS